MVASHHTSARTKIAALVREIKTLTEAETGLATRRASIHQDEIALVFTLGRKLNELHEICQSQWGSYKVVLAEAGITWRDADRKRKVWLLFGQYAREPWILNFGKSALQELASYYYSEKGGKACQPLIDEAMAIAKSGAEIGVAWVFAKIEGKKREAGERQTRLSARVRKLVHEAIALHGEEKVLEALGQLTQP